MPLETFKNGSEAVSGEASAYHLKAPARGLAGSGRRPGAIKQDLTPASW